MGSERKPKPGRDFHEAFAQEAVAPPSARSTGLVFAAVALIIAIIFRANPAVMGVAGAAALMLLALSFLAPRVLEPLNIVWFKFGMLLHRVVNPVVMFLMYAVAFVPLGLLIKPFYDPLRLKRDRTASTYWLTADSAETKLSSMKNQF